MWAKAGAIGVLAGALAGAWAGYEWRDGQAAKADLERERAAAKAAHRQAEIALREAQEFEEVRDAIQRDLRASQARLAAALAAPVAAGCPAVGDVVLPAGALDRVRAAAGEFAPGADPGQPRPSVRPGASAAGR